MGKFQERWRHRIHPLAGPGQPFSKREHPERTGAQDCSVHLRGLSSSGTPGEHLGSHQTVHLPPEVRSPHPAAAAGHLPERPSCGSARPSRHSRGSTRSPPSSTPSSRVPSPNFRSILASPPPTHSQPGLGTATRRRGSTGTCCRPRELRSPLTPVTKGGTHGSPTLFQFTVPKGEEQNRTPKPAGTEPSPGAQHWGPL